MDRVKKIVPFYKRAWYSWKSLRNVPFRKQFFVGYDLTGNTYWEFRLESGARTRPRRIWHPLKRQEFIFDYFNKLPIQWLQWLRYSRFKAPTLEELVNDEKRLDNLHKLVEQKDRQIEYKRLSNDNRMVENMYKELQKLEKEESSGPQKT